MFRLLSDDGTPDTPFCLVGAGKTFAGNGHCFVVLFLKIDTVSRLWTMVICMNTHAVIEMRTYFGWQGCCR